MLFFAFVYCELVDVMAIYLFKFLNCKGARADLLIPVGEYIIIHIFILKGITFVSLKISAWSQFLVSVMKSQI